MRVKLEKHRDNERERERKNGPADIQCLLLLNCSKYRIIVRGLSVVFNYKIERMNEFVYRRRMI